MLRRRLGVMVAGLLFGAVGWAAPATAADDGNTEPPPPDDCSSCEPPPPTYPTELGTAADHANDNAATGLGTAADAITAARTRQAG